MNKTKLKCPFCNGDLELYRDNQTLIDRIKILTAGYVLNTNYSAEYVNACVDISKKIINIIEEGDALINIRSNSSNVC